MSGFSFCHDYSIQDMSATTSVASQDLSYRLNTECAGGMNSSAHLRSELLVKYPMLHEIENIVGISL